METLIIDFDAIPYSKIPKETRRKLPHTLQCRLQMRERYETDPEYRERKRVYSKARYERLKKERLANDVDNQNASKVRKNARKKTVIEQTL